MSSAFGLRIIRVLCAWKNPEKTISQITCAHDSLTWTYPHKWFCWVGPYLIFLNYIQGGGAVTEDATPDRPRRRLFRHDHKKRSVRTWVVPLLVILGIIILLPKLVGLLEK